MQRLYKIKLLKMIARYCKDKQGSKSYQGFVGIYKSFVKCFDIKSEKDFISMLLANGWSATMQRFLDESIYKSNGGFVKYLYNNNRKYFEDRFIDFLKKHNALENYIENIDPCFIESSACGKPYFYYERNSNERKKMTMDEMFNILQPYSFIMYAFEWEKTPQGHDNWRQLTNEWEDEMNKYFSNLLLREL